jgi:DnaJ domain
MPERSAARRAAALAVLGLPTHATGAQIIDAYRRLARTTHPDATGRTDAAAARRFSEISDAYHLLAGEHAPAQAHPGSAAPTAAPVRPPERPRPTRPRGRGWPDRPPIVAGPVTWSPR